MIESATTTRRLPFDAIVTGLNYRSDFNEAKLIELAISIEGTGGCLQAPLVRPRADGVTWDLVCGERRLRAMRDVLDWTEADFSVAEMDDRAAARATLRENIARVDPNPMEEAEGFASVMERFGLTVSEVAVEAGIARGRVVWRLKLLDLSPHVREQVRSGRLPPGFARVMVGLDADRQALALAALVRDSRHATLNGMPAEAFKLLCGELLAQQGEQSLFGEGDWMVVQRMAVKARAMKLSRKNLLGLVVRLAAAHPDPELRAEAALASGELAA